MAGGGILASLRVVLSADTGAFSTGMSKARRDAATSASSIQKSLGGIKGAFSGLTAGLIGGAALSGLAALAKRSLEYASSLGETAQQLGVTSEALQVYRFAASQVGISNEEMDKSLAKLTRTAGEAAEGAKTQAEAFNKLGVNVLDANGKVKDTDRLMREVADGLSKIEDPAKRAAIEVDLLGRAGQKLDTLLAGGSAAIDELRDAAHRLGIVLSEEQIQRADETADKLSALKQVLEARISGAVADNANAIYDFANSLSTLVGEIIDVIEWLKRLDAAMPRMRVDKRGVTFSAGKGFGGDVGVGELGTSVSGNLGAVKPFRAASAAGLNRIAGGGGRKGPRGKSAEQIAAELERKRIDALRETYDRQRDISDAKADELRAQQDLLDDYVDRGTIERELIDIETDQRNKELALAVAIDKTYEPVAARLKEYNEQQRILKKQKVSLEVEADRQRDFEATEQARFDLRREHLQIEQSLADTAAERRKVELELLEIAFQQRRQALQRVVDETRDEEERKRAQRELAELPRLQAGQARAVARGTQGPLESYLASMPRTAEQFNERVEGLVVEELEAVRQGINDAIMDAIGVKDPLLAGLIDLLVQEVLIRPLAEAMQKARTTSGGGGGFLSTLLGLGAAAVGGMSGSAIRSTQPFAAQMMLANPGVFATGGYTGSGPRNQIGGVVHRGEFVLSAGATRKIGLPTLQAMNAGLMPAVPRHGRFSAGTMPMDGGTRRGDVHFHLDGPMTKNQARETVTHLASASRQKLGTNARRGMA